MGTFENKSGGHRSPFDQQTPTPSPRVTLDTEQSQTRRILPISQQPTSFPMDTLGNISVGERIRKERLKCGWSQQELAKRIGASKLSVHNWENGVIPQPLYQRQLAELFKKTIEELFTPNEILEISKQELEKPKYITLQHLPFIGRDEDILKILDKLQNEQFVAITGTIGVGKSELAKQVVKEAIRRRLFPSVKIIYLQDKSTEDALSEIESVLLQLPPNSLVVLDNCEHLRDFKEAINRLRMEHTQFYILATSRVEMTRSDYPIKSLKPDDAVQLFLKAADMIGKTPTDNDTPKVEELCTTLLYGLPLALLLAAGLLEPYPFDRVYIRAKEENSLIEAENYFSEEKRHQKTLKALYEEHYQSLGEDEQQGQQLQALFRRLAIFVAPCRIKAVKAVCSINNDLPEKEEKLQYLLEMLARHFLITYDYENGWIAIMHNILRVFARLKLKENNEASEVIRKFIDYYRSLVTDYMDRQFNKEELEITVYLESINGSFENILYACKLDSFSVFQFIESKVKNILGEEAYIQDQM